MANLGIVYEVEKIRELLYSNDKIFLEDAKGTKSYIIGLIVIKNPEYCNSSNTNRKDKYCLFSRLLYNTTKGYHFEEKPQNPQRYTPTQHSAYINFTGHDNSSRSPTNISGLPPIEDLFQFWNPYRKVDFIFLDANQLRMIVEDSNDIILSGTRINYGYGKNEFRDVKFRNNGEYSTEITHYPTIKMESDHIPTNLAKTAVAVGIPCPTAWGNDALTAAALQPLFIESGLQKPPQELSFINVQNFTQTISVHLEKFYEDNGWLKQLN